jgi:hypothetical protein
VPSIQEAIALVRDIEQAMLTGLGDIRSNAVIAKLLSIARCWIADHMRSDAASFDSAPTPLHGESASARRGNQTVERVMASSATTAGKAKPNGKDRSVARPT